MFQLNAGFEAADMINDLEEKIERELEQSSRKLFKFEKIAEIDETLSFLSTNIVKFHRFDFVPKINLPR